MLGLVNAEAYQSSDRKNQQHDYRDRNILLNHFQVFKSYDIENR